MKKLILFAVAAMSLGTAKAQYAGTNVSYLSANSKGQRVVSGSRASANKHHSGAKTTSVTIATENFGTGTDSTLPTGWTAGIINGSGTWHWTDVASTSANSIGPMHSTTAANGWMIFDADSIQNDCSCAPSGWMQSPAYNCTGHATVRLNFEDYYAWAPDTCEIWVSTDPTFTTYTSYPVTLNNSLTSGDTTANVANVRINITAVAAGQPAVYIRYVFIGNPFFEYSWMVDDMSLTELDPHNAGISGSFLLAPDPSALNASVFNTPLVFVDSFLPGTLLTNYGANSESHIPMNANIYQGTSLVYTHSIGYPSLPYNSIDSVVMFPGYTPASTGCYTCALSESLPGDADSTNNADTVTFNITDTTWMQNDTVVATNFFVYLPAGIFPGATASASMMGTRFDVPSSSIGDTVSGFGVGFSFITTPTDTSGGTVSVQLYSTHKGDPTWAYVGTSVARAITAADLPTDSTIVWADFRIDTAASGGVTPFILQPGTSYAAILQTKNVTTPLLLFASAIPPIPGMNGTFCLSDTSNNDGAPTFNPPMGDTGLVGLVPFIRMYFGPVPVGNVGVKNVALSNSVGAPYPVPANESVNIPFVTGSNAEVKITLSDMLGQVVQTKYITATGGRPMKATFATGDLADGIYNYSVDANGQHTNGKIEVSH